MNLSSFNYSSFPAKDLKVIQYTDDDELFDVIYYAMLSYSATEENLSFIGISLDSPTVAAKTELRNTLTKQLMAYSKESNKLLKHSDNKICLTRRYQLDLWTKTRSIKDLPTFDQVVNNHLNYYISVTVTDKISQFDIECEFTPLLCRTDGLALVVINRIKTTEVINSYMEYGAHGLSLETNVKPYGTRVIFNPIVLMDLSQFTNLEVIQNNELPPIKYENELMRMCDIHFFYLDNYNYNDFRDIDTSEYPNKNVNTFKRKRVLYLVEANN